MNKNLSQLQQNTIGKVMKGTDFRHTINVDYTDVYENFIGNITFKYPSQLDKLTIGVLSTELRGNLEVDVATANLAYIIATLDTVIVNKPDWFDLNSPYISETILYDVFEKYADWEKDFRLPSKPKSEESTEK